MRDESSSTPVGVGSADEFEVSRPRILVVDDEVFIACLLAEIITQDLHENSVQVYSAEDAIKQLEKGDFSLVISDIRMPGIGGFGLLQWIEEKRPELKQHFLFVTGCAGGPDANRMLANLGVPVVQKPFSCAELIEQCRELLPESRAMEMEVQGRCIAA